MSDERDTADGHPNPANAAIETGPCSQCGLRIEEHTRKEYDACKERLQEKLRTASAPAGDMWPRCIFDNCPRRHAEGSMFCSEHHDAKVRERENRMVSGSVQHGGEPCPCCAMNAPLNEACVRYEKALEEIRDYVDPDATSADDMEAVQMIAESALAAPCARPEQEDSCEKSKTTENPSANAGTSETSTTGSAPSMVAPASSSMRSGPSSGLDRFVEQIARPEQRYFVRSEIDALLADVRRETIEACAKVCDGTAAECEVVELSRTAHIETFEWSARAREAKICAGRIRDLSSDTKSVDRK